jgi:ferredoxin-nitrite reductase
MAVFSGTDGPKDVQRKVAQHASAGHADLILNDGDAAIGKLRLVGVYDDRQPSYFMLRIRIPGGRLTSDQAEAIGRIAQEFAVAPMGAGGLPERFLEVTTREDVQVHWVRLEYLPDIWRRLEAVGITTLQACGDTSRNITGCPVAGIDPGEVLDVTPVVNEVNRYVIENQEYGAFLPRKFKTALTGCRDDCILARINDLAFTPARRDGQAGFHVWVGGGLSDYPRLASQLDIFVAPDQVVATTKAVIDVFKRFGDYQNKAVNRFRRVVDDLGPDRVHQEVAARLPFPARPAGESIAGKAGASDHVGVHPQRQAGLSYMGLSVPAGRMAGEEFAEMARLAREHGDGGIRLTPRQDLIITGVRRERLDGLLMDPLLKKYRPDPPTFQRTLVACTSAPFCKFGIFNVKQRGLELAHALDKALAGQDLGPVRLHVSGCKASCAQPQIADIGLRATLAKDDDGYHEAFDVCAGGSLPDGHLGQWLALEIPAPRVQRGVESLLAAYRKQSATSGTFGQFLRRQDKEYLRSFFEGARHGN